jgi:hypothetical protein
MCDSDYLKSLGADLPYRHQPFWQTRRDHKPGQDSLCAVAAIRSVQPFRRSGRCLTGPTRGLKTFSGDTAGRRDYRLIEAHEIMDLRGAIPVFISITTGKVHDVRLLNAISLPAGSILVVDRGYLDFKRPFAALHGQQIGYVIRAKDNLRSTWIASRKVNTETGLRTDQTFLLAARGRKSAHR